MKKILIDSQHHEFEIGNFVTGIVKYSRYIESINELNFYIYNKIGKFKGDDMFSIYDFSKDEMIHCTQDAFEQRCQEYVGHAGIERSVNHFWRLNRNEQSSILKYLRSKYAYDIP